MLTFRPHRRTRRIREHDPAISFIGRMPILHGATLIWQSFLICLGKLFSFFPFHAGLKSPFGKHSSKPENCLSEAPCTSPVDFLFAWFPAVNEDVFTVHYTESSFEHCLPVAWKLIHTKPSGVHLYCFQQPYFPLGFWIGPESNLCGFGSIKASCLLLSQVFGSPNLPSFAWAWQQQISDSLNWKCQGLKSKLSQVVFYINGVGWDLLHDYGAMGQPTGWDRHTHWLVSHFITAFIHCLFVSLFFGYCSRPFT